MAILPTAKARETPQVTLENTGRKLIWLKLKSGSFVSIPTGRTTTQKAWECTGNPCVDKLIARGLLTRGTAENAAERPPREALAAKDEPKRAKSSEKPADADAEDHSPKRSAGKNIK